MQTFLRSEASDEKLIQAAAANHVAWFSRNALARGGIVERCEGLVCLMTPGEPNEATLAFPRLRSSETMTAQINRFLLHCREHNVRKASCWSLSPTQPPDLGVLLMARGFELGWRPHWMVLTLDNLPLSTLPHGLSITIDGENETSADDLPYYHPTDAPAFRALARARPRQVWHWTARDAANRIVGHLVLNLTSGPLGIAGIYNMGVVPDQRRRGIGRALLLTAGQFAREMGCHHALLNSASDDYYTAVGFRSLGWGQTWWMHAPVLTAPSPTDTEITFAEAVGRGDTATLDALHSCNALPPDLDAVLLGGTTPLGLAATTENLPAADWLLRHGATPEVLPLWELGGAERVRPVLSGRPDLANRPRGHDRLTPLHEAIARNDMPLLRLLLTLPGLDLSARDARYNGTPLDWAHHLNRPEMKALLEGYVQGKASPGTA